MTVSELNYSDLPEWYRSERETEKTIQKLSSVKELDFYLRNPDEFIRRLAVLRLGKLSGKDSLYALKEILDDPVESDENKYLAAWMLKSLSKNWEEEFFLTSRYSAYFNVYEPREEINYQPENMSRTLELDFTLSPLYSSLKLDPCEGTFEKDAFFKAEFDFRQWFAAMGSGFLKNSLNVLSQIPKFIIGLPLLAAKGIYKRVSEVSSKKREAKIKTVKSPKPELPVVGGMTGDFNCLRDSLYREPGKKSKAFSIIKKGAFSFLYYLFSPWRFLRRHKLAVVCMLLITYLIFTYTGYGRTLTLRYMSVDLKEFQDSSIHRIKGLSSYALGRLSGFLNIKESKENGNFIADSGDISDETSFEDSDRTTGKLYTVTAKNGLYVRKSPDPYSQKVGGSTLYYGSTVTSLSKAQKDSSGRVWFYIKSMDGRIGWASSVFLKEKEG